MPIASKLRVLFLCSAALSLAHCRSGRPDFTINVPANVLNVRPPRSALFIETPLRLALLDQAIDQAIARALPAGGGGAQFGVIDVRWRLTRQPATLSAAPPGLLLRVPITGEVSAGASFLRCQGSGIGGVFSIAVKPTLSPSGALVLREPQVSVQPVGALSCAGISVPMSELFSRMLKPLEQAIATAITALQLPLGPAIERGLAELEVPRGMDVEGKRACLDLDPMGLVVAPIGTGGGTAIRIGLDVAPRLSLGDCPARSPSAPQAVSVREEGSVGPSRVQVALAIPSAELQAPLAAAVVGKRFGSGSNAVTVSSAVLGDASGQAMVRLGVSGAYHGDLYLWGTAQVQSEGGRFVLAIPDLRVAAESSSKLEELKLNLFQLFDGDLASKLRPQLRVDVTSKLQSVQQRLSGKLEVSHAMWQKGLGGAAGVLGIQSLTLTSQLDEVRPIGVESRPGLLVAYVELVGTLRLEIR
jgi:hypothetical protein